MGARLWLVAGLVGILVVLLSTSRSLADDESWSDYLRFQSEKSVEYLLRNISPPGTARGVVIAATSKQNPDYYYHWIRDAALTMDVVVELYRNEQDPSQRSALEQKLTDYIDFSRKNQLTENPSGGLGEPKFNVDGSAFTGPWGRPQNDGPALRAITLTKLANLWLDEGKADIVKSKLYDSALPTSSVIKADLEYVASSWRDTCFDLWEEIKGHHFYTRMVQRRALLDGAHLAERLGDDGAAQWYLKQAKDLEPEILRHWDSGEGVFVPTLDRDGGIDYKTSGLDSSAILAALHGDAGDGFLDPSDDRMLSTFYRLQETFRALYPVNAQGPAVAIGRYPEDKYDGGISPSQGQGNPWVLLTAGFSEYLERAAALLEAKGGIEINDTNRDFFRLLGLGGSKGDEYGAVSDEAFHQALKHMRDAAKAYLDRVRYHGDPDGHFSEQINRETGFMQGAQNLTWSYGAFLTAVMHL